MRPALAWALGLTGAAAGLLLSLAADLPTGPTLVAVLGVLPVVAGLARLSRSAR